MKTTEYAAIDEKGSHTGFGSMIEALMFAYQYSRNSGMKVQIVKITRELCKIVDPADCQ